MNPFDKLRTQEANIDSKFKNRLKNQLFQEDTMHQRSFKQSFFIALKQAPLTAAMAMALILLVGVSTYALSSHNQKNELQKTITDNLEVPKDLSGILSVEQIKSKAASDAPSGATISQVELENEHGTILYKVRFSDGSFRFYDAKTGNQLQNTSNSQDQSSVPSGVTISLQDARNIAANRRPGLTITKIELESEHGATVYSVRFSDGARVDVNASSGAVLRDEGVSSSGKSGSGSSNSDSGGSDDSSKSGGSGRGGGDDGSGHD